MLEQSLVPLKSGRKRYLSLPISIALHGVIIAAAVAAAVWGVDLPARPPNQMTTYAVGQLPSVPGPPPALRGKADGGNSAARVERPATPVAPVAIPDDMPDVASETTIPADGSPTADGAPGGDPNGSPDGVPGGVGSGPRGGVVDAPGTDGILRPGGDVTVPVVISRVDPEYPELARRIGLSGVVVLECIIGRDGRVREPRIVQSPHALLDRAAVDAVQQWRFRPATLNGQPVDVFFHLTVRFTLGR